MSFKSEVTNYTSDLLNAHGAHDAHSETTCHFQADCDLSSASSRQIYKTASVDSGVPDREPKATPPTRTDSGFTSNSQPISEKEFMSMAPDAFRRQLGLPQNANSKDFVDRYIGKEVEHFEHSPDEIKEMRLRLSDIDGQTAKDILSHKPGSEKTLADLWTEKEKKWLDIPDDLQGEPAYKLMEDGILHNDYRAQVNMDGLLSAMGWE